MIRLEFETIWDQDCKPNTRMGSWIPFFAKSQPNNLGGREWAANFDMEPMMGPVIKLAAANLKNGKKFGLARSPSCSRSTSPAA